MRLQGLFFIIFSLSLHCNASEPKINVLIASSLPEVVVKGFDLYKNLHLKKPLKKQYNGKKIIKFNCQSTRKATTQKPRLVASMGTLSGVIDWNDQKYRGQLLLVTSPEQDSCALVNEISLETYISSLLSKEMRSDWPIEALKAQAVAARTYAYHKMQSKQVSLDFGHESYYDLENSEKHQVNGTLLDESNSTKKAAKETLGKILLTKNGELTPTFFHSKCGGRTLKPSQVWGGDGCRLSSR